MSHELDFITTLRVEFSAWPEKIDALKAKAAEVDDENLGVHLKEYTFEQALTVVFHTEPGWLTENLLYGWVVQDDMHWPEPGSGAYEEAAK